MRWNAREENKKRRKRGRVLFTVGRVWRVVPLATLPQLISDKYRGEVAVFFRVSFETRPRPSFIRLFRAAKRGRGRIAFFDVSPR